MGFPLPAPSCTRVPVSAVAHPRGSPCLPACTAAAATTMRGASWAETQVGRLGGGAGAGAGACRWAGGRVRSACTSSRRWMAARQRPLPCRRVSPFQSHTPIRGATRHPSAGIIPDEVVEPMPLLLRALCRRLTRWGLLPAAKEPNSAIINIYEAVSASAAAACLRRCCSRRPALHGGCAVVRVSLPAAPSSPPRTSSPRARLPRTSPLAQPPFTNQPAVVPPAAATSAGRLHPPSRGPL